MFAPSNSGTVMVGTGVNKIADLTLTLGGNAVLAAVNPVTHRAFIGANNANSGADSDLDTIDGNSYAADANSPQDVPTNPYSLAINPFTNKIYVTDYTAGELTQVDASSGSVLSSISVGTNPSAVVVDPVQNVVYVANTGSNSISV